MLFIDVNFFVLVPKFEKQLRLMFESRLRIRYVPVSHLKLTNIFHVDRSPGLSDNPFYLLVGEGEGGWNLKSLPSLTGYRISNLKYI